MSFGERKLLVSGLMAVAMALLLGSIPLAEAGIGSRPQAGNSVQAVAGQGRQPFDASPALPAVSPVGGGQVVSRSLVFTYDANGRLTGASYQGEKNITYRYDNAGNLTQLLVTSASAGPTIQAYIPALFKQFAGGW